MRSESEDSLVLALGLDVIVVLASAVGYDRYFNSDDGPVPWLGVVAFYGLHGGLLVGVVLVLVLLARLGRR